MLLQQDHAPAPIHKQTKAAHDLKTAKATGAAE